MATTSIRDRDAAPIIVGASSGSGSCAIVDILEDLGAYMGAEQNLSGDVMPFESVFNSSLNSVLLKQRSIQTPPERLPESLQRRLTVALLQAASTHLRSRPDHASVWGFKASRSIFLLPFLAGLFPGMRFIQLVRDGRDIALSRNRVQTNNHFEPLFAERLGDDLEAAAIRLWSRVNVEAANWSRTALGDRYLALRLEDLRADPHGTVQRLAAFSGLADEVTEEQIESAAARVRQGPFPRRWDTLPAKRIAELENLGRRGLSYFGYMAPEKPAAETPLRKSDCVAIVGMHRGGTSLTAGLVAAAGYDFGSALMPATKENAGGYWENEKLVAISDRFLRALGRHWSDVRPLEDTPLQCEMLKSFSDEAVALLHGEFGDKARVALKDPRMALLCDFWLSGLEKALGHAPRIILVLRNPASVAASLSSRDELAPDVGLALWISHMAEAERRTRPYDRLVIDYDELVERPEEVLASAAAFLGCAPNRLEAMVRAELRHQKPPAAAGVGSRGDAEPAYELYERLLRLTKEDTPRNRAAVTRVRNRISKTLEADAPARRQLDGRLRQMSEAEERQKEDSAMNLLRLFRQRDVLRLMGDRVAKLRSSWSGEYDHHIRHRTRSPAYLGYPEWLARFETGPIEQARVLDHFAALNPLPSFDLLQLGPAARDPETVLGEQAARHGRCGTVVTGTDTTGDEIARFVEESGSDYIALLDLRYRPQDEALTRLLCEAVAHPERILLYGDEDRIGAEGERTRPWFKGAAWDQDEHFERGLAGGLVLVRRDHLQNLGRLSADEAGDPVFSICAKMADSGQADSFRHLPTVLSSLRENAVTKACAEARGKALKSLVPDAAKIETGLSPETVRVRYPLPDPAPRVSIIIPTRDGGKHLSRCLNGLRRNTDYPDLEIIVIDNGSKEPETLRILSRLEASGQGTVIRHDAPFNYPQLNNIGRKAATGEILCLLNDDIEPMEPGWLREMVSQALRKEVGAVGAFLFHENGTVQHAGVVVGMGGGPGAHFMRAFREQDLNAAGFCLSARQYSAVTAACLVLRTSVYDEMEGMDPTHLPVSYNDVDFCLRLRQRGYRVLFTPYARLWHLESATRGNEKRRRIERQWRRDVDIMKTRWGKTLAEDPFLSPNISDQHSRPTLAFPPRQSVAWRGDDAWDADTIRDSVEEMAGFSGTPVGLVQYQASELALKCGHLALANSLITAAKRAFPKDPRVLLASALIAKQAKRTEDALHTLRHLVKLHPTTVSGLYNLGNLLLETGEPEEATEVYESALDHRPSHLGSAVNLAIAYGRTGRSDKAIEVLNKSLAYFPGHPALIAQLGQAHLQQGNVEAAIARLQESLKVAPDDRAAIFNLGTALKQAGNLDEALRTYQEGINRFGASEDVILNLAGIFWQKGDRQASQQLQLRFAQTGPQSEDFYRLLASRSFQLDDIATGFSAFAHQRRANFRGANVPFWTPEADIDGKVLNILAGSDRVRFLTLLPAIRALAKLLEDKVADWHITVPADLTRLAEQSLYTMPVNPPSASRRPDLTILIEQVPELLRSRFSERDEEIKAAGDPELALPEQVKGRVHVELSRVPKLTPGMIERAASELPKGGSVSFQSPDRKQGPLTVRALFPKQTTMVKKLPHRWDALDRLQLLANAELVVTDDPVLCTLAHIAGRRVLMLGSLDKELEWLPHLLDDGAVVFAP